MFKNARDKKKAYDFLLPAKDYPDQQIVDKIANGLVDFCRRWPTRFHE
jgi:hypothetical protein